MLMPKSMMSRSKRSARAPNRAMLVTVIPSGVMRAEDEAMLMKVGWSELRTGAGEHELHHDGRCGSPRASAR
jgi:hypothetical protein